MTDGNNNGVASKHLTRTAARARRLRKKIPIALQRSGRIVALAVRNYLANDDWLWASALTYTVALSIVPLLMLGFAVLKGLGELERVQPLILHYLSLESPVIREHLLQFLSNSRAGALGSLGAGTLVVFDIMTLWTIEAALNQIWKVQEGRPLIRKVSDYLSVTFTVPILLAAALTVAASFGPTLSHIPFSATVTSFALVWAGYAFLFLFFPYTKVSYKPALVGSFITAVLWMTAYWAYIHFQYQANYQPVYGALAAVPALLVWIYLSWSIVLFGAEIAAAAQYGTSGLHPNNLPPDFVRRAGLLVMIRAAEKMMKRRESVTVHDIVRELGISESTLHPILRRLKGAGFIVEGKTDIWSEGDYELLLCRAPSDISVEEILDLLDDRRMRRAYDWRIRKLLARLDHTEKSVLKGETLGDLVGGGTHHTRAHL